MEREAADIALEYLIFGPDSYWDLERTVDDRVADEQFAATMEIWLIACAANERGLAFRYHEFGDDND